MEKNVWGVLIQKPLGTQGKRKMTTPTAPKNQNEVVLIQKHRNLRHCLLYTSPSPRDAHESRMPSSA